MTTPKLPAWAEDPYDVYNENDEPMLATLTPEDIIAVTDARIAAMRDTAAPTA